MKYFEAGIAEFKGRIIDKIEWDEDEILFLFEDRTIYVMFHEKECCENVFLEDIAGYFNDLIGSEILQADEQSNEKTDRDGERERWTFYKLATIKGYVTLRWYGSSNGYYSEAVDLRRYEGVDRNHFGNFDNSTN